MAAVIVFEVGAPVVTGATAELTLVTGTVALTAAVLERILRALSDSACASERFESAASCLRSAVDKMGGVGDFC